MIKEPKRAQEGSLGDTHLGRKEKEKMERGEEKEGGDGEKRE